MKNIEVIINLVYPLIDQLKEKYKEVLIKEGKKYGRHKTQFYPYTPEELRYETEMYSIRLKSDLIKALSNYTRETDAFKNVRVSHSDSIVIYSTIERDGQEFQFDTEMIDAGGYNIQKYHYRCIVKTQLPKNTQNSFHKQYTKNETTKLKISEAKSKLLIMREKLSKYELQSPEQFYLEFHNCIEIPEWAGENAGVEIREVLIRSTKRGIESQEKLLSKYETI